MNKNIPPTPNTDPLISPLVRVSQDAIQQVIEEKKMGMRANSRKSAKKMCAKMTGALAILATGAYISVDKVQASPNSESLSDNLVNLSPVAGALLLAGIIVGADVISSKKGRLRTRENKAEITELSQLTGTLYPETQQISTDQRQIVEPLLYTHPSELQAETPRRYAPIQRPDATL